MRSRSVGLSSVCKSALLSGVVALAAVGGLPSDALAQKPPAGQPAKKPLTDKQKKDEAGKLFKEANGKFDKGDYAAAAALYEECDSLFPGAKPKERAAVSYDKMGGKVKEAASWYEKFLADSPDPEKFKNNEIADAKSRLEALKKTPAKVKVTTDPPSAPGLKLAVDGAAQPGPELSVPPGKHKITATADGYDPANQDIEVAFADTKDVTLTLSKASAPVVAAVPVAPPTASTAPPPKEPEKPAEPRSNVPAYVTLGLAGVGAIVGTIFGIQALSAKSEFDDNPTTDNADKTDRDALIADMSFAVALTFGVTGTVLLLSNGKSEEAKPAPAARRTDVKAGSAFITPYAGPKGGGAAATFKF